MNDNALFERFDRLNDTMRQIADNMPKPAGRLTGVLETAVLVVSIFGIVNIADIIMKWIIGG
jgi:hypothetical protein